MPAAAALGCVFVLPVCVVFPFMLRVGRKCILLENDARRNSSSSNTWLCLCASCLCCISFYAEGRQGSCLADVQMMPASALGCVFVLTVCVIVPFVLRCGRKNVWLEKMPAAAALACVFVLPVCVVFPFMLRVGRDPAWLVFK